MKFRDETRENSHSRSQSRRPIRTCDCSFNYLSPICQQRRRNYYCLPTQSDCVHMASEMMWNSASIRPQLLQKPKNTRKMLPPKQPPVTREMTMINHHTYIRLKWSWWRFWIITCWTAGVGTSPRMRRDNEPWVQRTLCAGLRWTRVWDELKHWAHYQRWTCRTRRRHGLHDVQQQFEYDLSGLQCMLTANRSFWLSADFHLPGQLPCRWRVSTCAQCTTRSSQLSRGDVAQ